MRGRAVKREAGECLLRAAPGVDVCRRPGTVGRTLSSRQDRQVQREGPSGWRSPCNTELKGWEVEPGHLPPHPERDSGNPGASPDVNPGAPSGIPTTSSVSESAGPHLKPSKKEAVSSLFWLPRAVYNRSSGVKGAHSDLASGTS